VSGRLPPGKVAPEVLSACLALCPTAAPDVLLGPALGEDAAIVDCRRRLLCLTADPITFATDRIGWYAVNVAANDIATRGVDPRWLLLTLLLPEGTREDDCLAVFGQVGKACEALGVVLVGGHTEVTSAVVTIVASATMAGVSAEGRYLTTGAALPGDEIVLTRGCGIEGTAILAREYGERLSRAGVSEAVLRRAAGYLDAPGISVVRVARAVRGIAGVRALHDPTEGGVLCGLAEIAVASGFTVRVDPGALFVREETLAVCAPFGIDPHGLIASGALLVACSPDSTGDVVRAVRNAGDSGAVVARVVDGEPELRRADTDEELPWSHRDEIARASESSGTGEEP